MLTTPLPDLGPVCEHLQDYRTEHEAELANEVFQFLPTRDLLMAYLRDLEALADKYAAEIMNRCKPAQAPLVAGPRQRHPDYSDSDMWHVDGWEIVRNYDSGTSSAAFWQAPDGAMFDLRKDGRRKYLPAEAVADMDTDITDESYEAGWPVAEPPVQLAAS